MLKELTLENLKETKLKPLFDKALNEVLFSLYQENDIPGKRELMIKITFELDGGDLDTRYECIPKTPHRSSRTLAILEDHTVKIETTSNDARQPGFEFDSEKVKQITEAKSAKKEGAAS